MTEIPLVDAEEVRARGGHGKTKGEKYSKYAVAIQKHLNWVKEAIEKSKDGTIRMKAADFAKELGGEFAKKNPTSIYWGLKFVFFNEGIVVETATHVSGEKIFTMRLGTEEDQLPPSLRKFIDSDDDEPEPPIEE